MTIEIDRETSAQLAAEYRAERDRMGNQALRPLTAAEIDAVIVAHPGAVERRVRSFLGRLGHVDIGYAWEIQANDAVIQFVCDRKSIAACSDGICRARK